MRHFFNPNEFLIEHLNEHFDQLLIIRHRDLRLLMYLKLQ